MAELSKQYTVFTLDNLDSFECDCITFGLCSTLASDVSEVNAKLPQGAESNILPYLH